MALMIANTFVNLLGIFLFLFLFWKKLKDDHASEIIFSCAYTILGSILVAGLISKNFFPEWFFWSEFIGALLAVGFSILKFRMRLFETIDGFVISILPWISVFYLKDSVTNSSLPSFIGFVVVLFLMFIYYFLETRYKSFAWYKSGKVGFSGLVTLFLFFLVRSGASLIEPHMLTFTSIEVYLSGSLALLSLILVVYLGRLED